MVWKLQEDKKLSPNCLQKEICRGKCMYYIYILYEGNVLYTLIHPNNNVSLKHTVRNYNILKQEIVTFIPTLP